MSIYTLIPEEVVAEPLNYDLRLTERDIYGSSRLGTENINQVIASTTLGHININTDLTQVVGDKNYELSNLPTKLGIGNVLQVVTDRKLAIDSGDYNPESGTYYTMILGGDGVVDYYVSDVVTQSDYYPFGMLLPGRNSSEEEYRYGFNGMEMDDEIHEVKGSSYDFGARLYNPRIGRWLSRDPKAATYPSFSPYIFSVNSPISCIDIGGEYTIFVNGEVGNEQDQRRNVKYWSEQFVNRTTKAFGWENHEFFDGDKGNTSSTDARRMEGYMQAKASFASIISKLEKDENGKIIESVDLVSHSKGSAWAAGFQDAWNEMVSDPKVSEQFADGNGEIGLNLMLAPHQSNFIEVESSSTVVVGICHDYDQASGNDVGDDSEGSIIINIQTDNGHQTWEVNDTHTINGFHAEAEAAIKGFKNFKESGFNPQSFRAAVKAVKDASKSLWNEAKKTYSNDN